MANNAAYSWDPGNPWQIVESGGALQIVESRVDETEAYQHMTKKKMSRFAEGDAVMSLQGVLPLTGRVEAIKEGGIVVVKDDASGVVSTVHEADLEPIQPLGLFSFPAS